LAPLAPWSDRIERRPTVVDASDSGAIGAVDRHQDLFDAFG
jgi:hypothetical protein